jgi:hypothetical protein
MSKVGVDGSQFVCLALDNRIIKVQLVRVTPRLVTQQLLEKQAGRWRQQVGA